MAFTGSPVDSVQRALGLANKTEPRDAAKLYCRYANYTHAAGAGTGEINMFTLPPGRIRIYPDLCRYMASANGAAAMLHIGHRAYADESGTAVAEDDNEWLDNLDITSAVDAAWGDGATTLNQYESQSGIVVFITIDAQDLADDDTFQLLCVFAYL